MSVGHNLLKENHVYKPFMYPWAYDAWLMQQRIHWLPEEVPLADDVRDWKHNLKPSEKNLLTQIFRFFTQADIEVNNCYMKHYSQVFKPTEVQMMLSAFSNMETIHIAAYSHLLDTVGMPEIEYSAFMKYKEMKDKYDYMQGFNVESKRDIAKTLAIFGAFTEGLQLFASFAMLLNFQRFNKMKGMGQIVTWSVRDESLHCASITKLFHTFIAENREIWDSQLKKEIYQACRTIVEHEDAFIDLAFSMGEIEGMTADDIKQYIRFIADRRLKDLGLKAEYKIEKNPLPWLDKILNAPEMGNFFEVRVTEYTKAATKGSWETSIDEELIIVNGQDSCVFCAKAKALLDVLDVKYKYIDLTGNDIEKQRLKKFTGMTTMPIIFSETKDEEYGNLLALIGGFNELETHLKG